MSFTPAAQVCVIDDEPREYLPLLHTLNALRMGCVLIRGDKAEELPAEGHQLTNLRLVFLDMHLGTTAEMSDTAIANHTAHVFSRVVSPASAPIAVVVWTKFAKLVGDFRSALFRVHPEFQGGLFFILVEKPHPSARIDRDALKVQIEGELNKLQPLSIIWGWNSAVQRAACGVTAELCRLSFAQASVAAGDSADVEREKTLFALNAVLQALLSAEAGRTLTKENAPQALLDVLGPLHADRLEHSPVGNEVAEIANLLGGKAAEIGASPEVRVALNTMLLTGSANTSGNPFRPGTVFHISNYGDFSSATGLAVDEIGKALFRQPQKGKEKEHAEQFATWFAGCKPVLIEVSPNCDFAQQKRPVARLLAGLLVSKAATKDLIKTSKEEGYSARRELGQLVRVASVDKTTEWALVFCSAISFSWPESKAAPFLHPICRLKEPLVADLRNWLSHQGARPGYLSVD